jgi:phospholipid:diacylglycerol acyltransferase
MCRLLICACVGSDPPGIKLRAAKALEAVDYFVPGYWVFSKLVQSLADIGYDNNNLVRCGAGLRLSMCVACGSCECVC